MLVFELFVTPIGGVVIGREVGLSLGQSGVGLVGLGHGVARPVRAVLGRGRIVPRVGPQPLMLAAGRPRGHAPRCQAVQHRPRGPVLRHAPLTL